MVSCIQKEKEKTINKTKSLTGYLKKKKLGIPK
jgi:hypothetical protein